MIWKVTFSPFFFWMVYCKSDSEYSLEVSWYKRDKFDAGFGGTQNEISPLSRFY
jgi:hypothetical protein